MSDKLKAASDSLVGVWGNLSEEIATKVREVSPELADALANVKAVIEEEAEKVD